MYYRVSVYLVDEDVLDAYLIVIREQREGIKVGR